MPKFDDALRGYGHKTHEKCHFTCVYCGYDGRAFPNWFQLTIDHVRPVSQGGKDDPDNLVTACHACNSITSRMKFDDGASRDEILALKRKRVRQRQTKFFEFWQKRVAPLYLGEWQRDDPA